MTRARHIRAKYSGGPKRSAKSAIGPPASVNSNKPKVPAMKEPNAAMPNAGPARPCSAIWCPSMHVTTEAPSPGILTRMEVVEPPYIEP